VLLATAPLVEEVEVDPDPFNYTRKPLTPISEP
jgi:hypothetical protein